MSSNQTQSPNSGSKGNTKTQGNKGNNFPFQFNQLLAQGETTAAIQSGFSALIAILGTKEYEAKLVEDSAGSPLTWLEVRVYNTGAGTFDPPVYYLAGSTVAGSPTLPIFYLNDSTVLSTIASNTTGLATEVTLAAANAKLNSLGQKASVASMPVVLSTEQEALIDGIEALLTTIDGDTSNLDAALTTLFGTLGQKASVGSAPVVLSTEQQVILTAIKTAVEAIDLDADSLASEITIAAINAKFGSLGQKLSAGSAPVVLSTEQEALIDGIEGLLTTIDADTSNLDVALSTIAKEATLLIIDSVLDSILLDTTAIKTATEAINTKLTSVSRVSSLTNIIGIASATIGAGARSVTFANRGPTDATVAGGTLKSGRAVTFSAGAEEDTLADIAYVTIATGELDIVKVV